ncbi:MAG TPA: ADOP family duplicated permease [Gammaproteobacteria bacterium]|nr:ADOP family duplicated permease [Gammaproteobacteria bacterium]
MSGHFWNDVRLAARSLARAPGFAAAAILTIALGIGVNTGIFSIINGVLFRDLPAPDAHELVSIRQTVQGVPDRKGPVQWGLFSTAEHRAYRDRSRTLSAIMGYSDPTSAMLGGESPTPTNGLLVTCGYFDVLAETPVVGRNFVDADCDGGAAPVVVLGHDLWTSAFAADPGIVGRTVELNRQLFTVVGVAPPRVYSGMYRAGFFAPVSAERFLAPSERRYDDDQTSWLFVVGRRNAGAGLAEVRAELAVIAAQIDAQQPGRATKLEIEQAKPLTVPPFVRPAAAGAGAVVMAAFGLILLIACANVANLLLARGTSKSKEIAVRLALGASRTRIVRELLIESTLLSIAGGALGSMLAIWSFAGLFSVALPTIMPAGLPMLGLDMSPDVRVLALTLALTVGTGLVFGLAPALQASKPDLHSVMKQDSSGAGGRGSRLQATLVGTQVALCMLLMAGAGLLLRGLYSAHTVDPGYDYGAVTVLSYDYVDDTGHDGDAAFWQRLVDDVRALPGVEAAAYAAREPLGDDSGSAPIRLPGDPPAATRFATPNAVGPDYFAAVGLPIVRGRAFTAADAGEPVAIVSESTARNLWGSADPIGRTLLQRVGRDQDVEQRVVGVVKDAQVVTLGQIEPYYVYRATRVADKLVVRSRMDFAATAAALRGVVRNLDPSLPAPVYPLAANLDRWRSISGLVSVLAATLAGLALALAAVGIYGVVAYFVGRRFREIGIRVALGAGRASVLGMVLRRTLRPVAVGATLGAAAAVAASGVLSGVLFGVSPLDPAGLLGAVLFVLGVAVATAAWAARRATRLDPMVTLRYE